MTQAFDPIELLERVDNDVGFLAELNVMLKADGPALLDEARTALAAGDAPALRRAAHTLKGMVSNFCAAEAHALARAAEEAGKAGDCAAAADALARLAPAMEALLAELDAFIRART